MHKIKSEVWQANMSLWENRLVCGTQGNVSGIDPDSGTIYIKPSGVAYSELKEEMLVGIDMEGDVKEGTLNPSVDSANHLFLYRNIESARGVCHTHSRFVTIFSVLKKPVQVFTTAQADVFGSTIPVAEYVDNSGDRIGRSVLEMYRETGCNAVILANHGLFSVGDSPQKAAFYALMAEYCAEIAFYSTIMGRSLGEEPPPLDPDEIKKWFDRYQSKRYGQKRP